MAGDWIKMRIDLRDDPAVFRLAELLGVDEIQVIGGLFCFWAWADKHAVDGRVDGAASRLVDRVSLLPGFADALVSVGWLVIDEGGILIPNFERHNGESAKERGLKNARQAKWRLGKASRVDDEASTHASTREEKRRDISPLPPEGADRFDEFWDAWPTHPRKAAKQQCRDKWVRRGCDPIADQILKAVRAQSSSPKWSEDGGRFVPAPLVWLNQARWEAPLTGAADPFAGAR